MSETNAESSLDRERAQWFVDRIEASAHLSGTDYTAPDHIDPELIASAYIGAYLDHKAKLESPRHSYRLEYVLNLLEGMSDDEAHDAMRAMYPQLSESALNRYTAPFGDRVNFWRDIGSAVKATIDDAKKYGELREKWGPIQSMAPVDSVIAMYGQRIISKPLAQTFLHCLGFSRATADPTQVRTVVMKQFNAFRPFAAEALPSDTDAPYFDEITAVIKMIGGSPEREIPGMPYGQQVQYEIFANGLSEPDAVKVVRQRVVTGLVAIHYLHDAERRT